MRIDSRSYFELCPISDLGLSLPSLATTSSVIGCDISFSGGLQSISSANQSVERKSELEVKKSIQARIAEQRKVLSAPGQSVSTENRRARFPDGH